MCGTLRSVFVDLAVVEAVINRSLHLIYIGGSVVCPLLM